MHVGITSSLMTDFTLSGRMLTPISCNEAESCSIALRLADLLGKASAWGLLLSPLAALHDGYLVVMMITFQTIREVRLGLAHQSVTGTRR